HGIWNFRFYAQQMDKMNHNAVIEIFSGTSWEAEMVRSLLSDAGIASFIKNNVLGNYLIDPIGASGVKVMILESDLEEAKGVVQGYYERMRDKSNE
ncbi:MAG: DUF2007 domain-containing protein, partial [Bacteroidales bacterium]|nr:DUF2007 domain-containing protein [Bacteroidales bacterium]